MSEVTKKRVAGSDPLKAAVAPVSKKGRTGPKSGVPKTKIDAKLSQRLSKIGKHKKKNKTGVSAFSYTVLPKGKRLAGEVVEKLRREKYHHVLARALDAARRLKQTQNAGEVEEEEETDSSEEKFKTAEKTAPEYMKWKQNKMHRIATREKKRRKRREFLIKEELRRKKYRIHPGDLYHMYLDGYERKRHRITKKRFMRCVDVGLLKAVMEKNQELVNSQLWDDEIDLNNLSFVRARILKDHLQQFEVLEEALKQGIFNIKGCDDLPILNIKRKRKPKVNPCNFTGANCIPTESGTKVGVSDKKKSLTKQAEQAAYSRRRLTYPPFKEAWNEGNPAVVKTGWLSKVTSWIATTSVGDEHKPPAIDEDPAVEDNQEPEEEKVKPDENEAVVKVNAPVETEPTSEAVEKDGKIMNNLDETEIKDHIVEIKDDAESEPETKLGKTHKRSDNNNPFSDYLTIKVPLELGEKKKFIYNLVERRIKDEKNLKSPEWLKKMNEKKPTNMNRFDKKYDPMDRLHEDEKESDIWTISTTTTTDGYASWRRPPVVNKSVDETDDWSETDKAFLWRVVMFLIVMWELYCFVDKRVDDVYYSTLTYHLNRENIWPVRPGLFPETETYSVLVVQEWLHFVISMITLPIIHKENECLSLLFAFSMLLDGFAKVMSTSHDALFLPHEASWKSIVLYSIHLLWKTTVICFFVGYHYYSVDYIRKEREFKHRKISLHNHEIMAKGTKGLQKRKLAWDWMVRHGRNTNIRALKKKYPNVKDGNFPEEDLEKHVKFDEAKELRIYAQEHNLNIGYPYNKLRDMKRYVFGALESSAYSSSELDDQKLAAAKVNIRQGRDSVNALTTERYEKFKEETIMKQNTDKVHAMVASQVLSKITSQTAKSAPKRATRLRAGHLALGQDYNAEIGVAKKSDKS
ncbi:hypothetical protein Ocin01_06918 [Orchesella cincta]|uniref:Uncharacterized protein n=1 Tax=Orchesella cincta TaxID=48709 RepID=A0A1D2N3X5_ORCCI|nr:hypothetical protein Ocin01_06918 [Orchesella cincta]